MAKRDFDTMIWDDEWFQSLPIEWKCFWFYLLTKCDVAGAWKVNERLAEFQLGVKIDWSNADTILNKGKNRVDFYDDLWLIKDFVSFQYGDISNSTHAFHKKIRQAVDTLSNRVYDRAIYTRNNKKEVKERSKEGVIGGELQKEVKPAKEKYLDFVLLTKDEYDKLKFGIRGDLDGWLHKLNDYLGSTGKRYKSHYHTILNWARKDNAILSDADIAERGKYLKLEAAAKRINEAINKKYGATPQPKEDHSTPEERAEAQAKYNECMARLKK